MGHRRLCGISPRPPRPTRDRLTAATEAYLIEEDSFSRWVEECCVVDPKLFGNGNILWNSWKEWAERNNEPEGSRKSFTQTMEQHGYRPDKFREKRGYWGIDASLPLADE